jgi:protein-disulfide isomerase
MNQQLSFMRPWLAVFALLCSLCFATHAQQSPVIPNEIRARIEKQVRQYAEAPPDAQIILGAPKPSDFTAYYALSVTIRGNQGDRTFDFLLAQDFTRLIYPKTFDLTEDPFAKAERSMDLSGRPVRGNPQAAVTIVMYDDLQCPFCARQYIALFNEVMNHYRDRVKVVLKDFPLTDAHPWAMDAAITADCLALQSDSAYWQFADYVHTHQQAVTSQWNTSHAAALKGVAEQHASNIDQPKLQACVSSATPRSAVEKSLAEGHSLGVSATPATFINGEFFEGVLTPEQVRAAIERAIRESKVAAK